MSGQSYMSVIGHKKIILSLTWSEWGPWGHVGNRLDLQENKNCLYLYFLVKIWFVSPRFYQGSELDPNLLIFGSAILIFQTIKNDNLCHSYQLPVFQFLGLDLVRRGRLPGYLALQPKKWGHVVVVYGHVTIVAIGHGLLKKFWPFGTRLRSTHCREFN